MVKTDVEEVGAVVQGLLVLPPARPLLTSTPQNLVKGQFENSIIFEGYLDSRFFNAGLDRCFKPVVFDSVQKLLLIAIECLFTA